MVTECAEGLSLPPRARQGGASRRGGQRMSGYDAGGYRGYLGQVPMLAACSDAQIEEVRELAEFRALNPGTVIVREGEQGEEFFVLGSGEATVSRGGAEVARLGPGAFFGELSLFDDAPRNATV